MGPLVLPLLTVSLSLLLYHMSSAGMEEIYTLMPNVLVLKVNLSAKPQTRVPLVCGEARAGEEVWWREGERWPRGGPRGNRVSVLVQEQQGGNFSCHNAAGDYLNHTLVLVEEQGTDTKVILHKSNDFVYCWTQNYSGEFWCSWKRTQNRQAAAVVLVSAKRGSRALACSLDSEGSSVACSDNSSCAYAEERELIHIDLYMVNFYNLEHYSKLFLLRNIVRPDPLPVTQSQDTLTWEYPPTWDKPCSYFPLLFQVRLAKDGSSCDSPNHHLTTETRETHYTVRIQRKQYRFCLRARDEPTNGPWSQWTHIEVKKSKKHHH